MFTKTLVLAGSFILALSGAAIARPEALDGISQGVPSSYTAMKRRGKMKMKRSQRRSGDVAPTATRGAPAGSSSGNGATGSGAAPSGR